MSLKVAKFCPDCGGNLGDNKICVRCGFNASSEIYKAPVKIRNENADNLPTDGRANFWNKISKFIPILGKWAWVPMIVFFVVTVIVLLVQAGNLDPGMIVWGLIQMGVALVFGLIYVLPVFSKKCEAQEYDFLLDDVIAFGNLRIPKMFLFGIIIVIFTNVWGGIILLFFVLMLIFVKSSYNWNA